MSKSCQLRSQVHSAMPAPANAKPMKMVAGNARSAHHDSTRPSASMTTKKPRRRRARGRAPSFSPAAMSFGPSGVARIAS